MKKGIRKIIPSFVISGYHLILAWLGAVFYRFPSRKLKVIGVTGTNGKSTVVNLASRILEEAGFRVALISSIKFKIGPQEWPNTLKMTMPGRFKIQRFLRKALRAGCEYVLLEVTSEGIIQHRHRFIDFDVAVFTNLTPEHLEAHGSFKNYKEAKGELFKRTKGIHIINLDDYNSDYFLKFRAEKKYTYGLKQGEISNESVQLDLKLPGEFNISNALAAVSVGLSQGLDLDTCRKVLEEVKEIPGRMEEVISKPFKVVVDYAHTPDSLEKVYKTVKPPGQDAGRERLICVLGACGGGRDKWKRPELGKIAARYCNQIILTNEDPYDENPSQILEDIEKGLSPISEAKYKKILDRRKAIKRALKIAGVGDTVIITGKGSEPWICVKKGIKIPWDDRKIVKQEFKKLNSTF